MDPNQNQHPLCQTGTLALAKKYSEKKQYSAEGILDQTTDLLESSHRPRKLHNYKTGSQKWSSWCLLRKINPVSAGVNFRLEFLSNLFSK